jgi:hypothetical protein
LEGLILIKITMALILMLLASTAFASGPIVVDIVGSTTDNTQVIRPNAESIELEIIGSMANNTNIAPKAPVKVEVNCPRPEKSKPLCKPYPVPEIPHLGVDAWYGEYWYTPVNMPKWPQL